MQRKSASMKCNIDKELRAYRFLFIRIIVGSKIDSRGPQSFYFLFHMIDYIPTYVTEVRDWFHDHRVYYQNYKGKPMIKYRWYFIAHNFMYT